MLPRAQRAPNLPGPGAVNARPDPSSPPLTVPARSGSVYFNGSMA